MENIFATCVGVVFGGLISWLLGNSQRKHELQSEKRQILIGKYEELHACLNNISSHFNKIGIEIIRESVTGESFKPENIDKFEYLDRAEMLIEFYVPELKEDYAFIKKQNSRLGEIASSHITEKNRTKEFLSESSVRVGELNKVAFTTIDNLKAKLASVVQEKIKFG